jgi:hypothetical protein
MGLDQLSDRSLVLVLAVDLGGDVLPKGEGVPKAFSLMHG